MSDDEFDDWFNEAGEADLYEEIGNQAAKFDTRDFEYRTLLIDGIDGAASRCSGQIYVRFHSPDGSKKIFKAYSGTLVKKLNSKFYVIVTAAHIFELI